MYVDSDTATAGRPAKVWVSERDVTFVQDPYRRAAQRFAAAVETFLYDFNADLYNDRRLLAAALKRFDYEASGGGAPTGSLVPDEIDEAFISLLISYAASGDPKYAPVFPAFTEDDFEMLEYDVANEYASLVG